MACYIVFEDVKRADEFWAHWHEEIPVAPVASSWTLSLEQFWKNEPEHWGFNSSNLSKEQFDALFNPQAPTWYLQEMLRLAENLERMALRRDWVQSYEEAIRQQELILAAL